MAEKLDKSRVEYATAMVKYRTAVLEIRARKIQLLVALVGFSTTAIGGIGALLVMLQI